MFKIAVAVLLILVGQMLCADYTLAQNLSIPKVSLGLDGVKDASPQEFATSIQILLALTVLTLAPSILVMTTCFTRIIVVFYFLRTALGTATQPPNQLLTSLAFFLTIFIMQPVINEANDKGLQPYLNDEITQSEAMSKMVTPFRTFMLKHTREEDLGLFIKLTGGERPQSIDDVSIWAVIPAYTISELKIAFQIGFLIFIPFLVLDMVIASTLMSLGMMMLPPQMISLPIKILLFVLVDGWYLIVDSLIKSIG
ncbi:MAG: flagellar type III secretion system pore protein FliP [Ignavibacteria bacterium]|jgi:flagellar biosynthetic protein FliP|nr:flagellar type III secretion system pore protein FliP [Ignavibacteria bacterium]